MKTDSKAAITATVAWLESIVIDLNLCPFAKAIHAKNQIQYSVCDGNKTVELLAALRFELGRLAATDAKTIDSTLVIFTSALVEFTDYGNLLDLSRLLLDELKLEGIIQIASFHPAYQFAGTDKDDVSNYTNRSPFPRYTCFAKPASPAPLSRITILMESTKGT